MFAYKATSVGADSIPSARALHTIPSFGASKLTENSFTGSLKGMSSSRNQRPCHNKDIMSTICGSARLSTTLRYFPKRNGSDVQRLHVVNIKVVDEVFICLTHHGLGWNQCGCLFLLGYSLFLLNLHFFRNTTIPTHNPTYNNPTYNKHPIKILSTLCLGQILGRVVADEVLGVQLQQRADLRHERVNRGLLTLTHHTQPHL